MKALYNSLLAIIPIAVTSANAHAVMPTSAQIAAKARELQVAAADHSDRSRWTTCKMFAQRVVTEASRDANQSPRASLDSNYCDPYVIDTMSHDTDEQNDFGHEVPLWDSGPGDIIQLNLTRRDVFNQCDANTDATFAEGPDGFMHTAIVNGSVIFNPTAKDIRVPVIDANNYGDAVGGGHGCYGGGQNPPATNSSGWVIGCIQSHNWKVSKYLDNCPNSAPYLHAYRAGPEDTATETMIVKELVKVCKEDQVYKDFTGTPIVCRQEADLCSERGITAGDTLHHFVTFENAGRNSGLPIQVRVDAYQENENTDPNNNMTRDWSYTATWQTQPRLTPTLNGRATFHFTFENVRAHDKVKRVGSVPADYTVWNFYIYAKGQLDADFPSKPKAHVSYKVYRNPNPPGYVVNDKSYHYPNPAVCRTDPTPDSRWFYRCQGNESNQFNTTQTVYISARIDAVQRNHRLRYDVYKDQVLVPSLGGYTGYVNPVAITPGFNLWDFAFHRFSLSNLPMGAYEVKMFVETNNQTQNGNPDLVATFGVVDARASNPWNGGPGGVPTPDAGLTEDAGQTTPPPPPPTPPPTGSNTLTQGNWQFHQITVLPDLANMQIGFQPKQPTAVLLRTTLPVHGKISSGF